MNGYGGRFAGSGTTEIVGGRYDVIMGDGDNGSFGADEDLLDALAVAGSYEIIGQNGVNAQQARRQQLAQSMRNARAVDPRAIAVRENALRTRRRFPLGLVPTSVATGVTATIPAAPQNLFRPERVTVPSNIAFEFGVVDIKVGNQSQLVSGGEVPAAIFTEVSIDNNVTFATAEVGNQISMTVRNKSAGTIEFTGALMGTVAQQ